MRPLTERLQLALRLACQAAHNERSGSGMKFAGMLPTDTCTAVGSGGQLSNTAGPHTWPPE
ncbi:hypothetical protein J6590_025526 [Homalodisca vitripennis]|nr:hypothetical protein J6590_025526 [Homalodisca vitripennis]